ncbi:hypothetical protein HK104_009564 [Borealophlyctis nickersoniae]|nr:hypothetical protein HK104_009564 [Borealophlyctis nickersoniae]
MGLLNCCLWCIKPKEPKPDAFVESLPDGPQKSILRQVHKTAYYLDKSFMGIGLDPIVGLIPVVGDVVGVFWALALIAYATKLGLPKDLINKMVRNAVLDFGVGLVPVLGDVFDVFYRADIRNYKIMRKYVKEQMKQAEQQRLEQSRMHRIDIVDDDITPQPTTTGNKGKQVKGAKQQLALPAPSSSSSYAAQGSSSHGVPSSAVAAPLPPPPPPAAAASTERRWWWSKKQPAPIQEMSAIQSGPSALAV